MPLKYSSYAGILILIFIAFLVLLYFNNGDTLSNGGDNLSLTRSFLMHADNVTVANNDPNLLMVSSNDVSRSVQQLPPNANVWNNEIKVLDQGPWGSCTAFAMRYAYLINQTKFGPLVEPSTAFWYSKARELLPGKLPLKDTGTTLKAMVTVVATQGTLPETAWRYSGYRIFQVCNRIPESDFVVMRALPITNSVSANTITLKTALAAGNPVLIAIRVYASFMTTNVFISGIVPAPKRNDKLLGGHAICLTGYDDAKQTFNFYNSWGTYTGMAGLFTLPYAYASSPAHAGEYYSF